MFPILAAVLDGVRVSVHGLYHGRCSRVYNAVDQRLGPLTSKNEGP